MTIAIVTLLITIVVETAIALILQRTGIIDAPAKRLRVDVPLINLATHPAATFVVRSGLGPFALVELFVFIAELCLYRCVTRLCWREAFTLAAVANGVTVLLSLVAVD